MKEASGEATMTVVTIAIIAVVLVAGSLIATNVMKSTKRQSCCSSLGGTWTNGTCSIADTNAAMAECLK